MSILDRVVDFGTALGRGVYSVGEDIVYGLERTAEGYGVRGWDRSAQIGQENEYLVGHLVSLVKYGIRAPDSPLYRIVVTILEKYYEKFPDDAIEKLSRAAAIGGGYALGRMVIGKKLAETIALGIARRIAASAAYKQFATKLGVSAGAGATGVGIVITLVMVQGVGQRASRASRRLRDRNRALWNDLRAQEGLDMLYFLVEEPLKDHMDAIELAHSNREAFEDAIRRQYGD